MKIGFVGLGVMGRPMAKRLIRAGYDLAVYDRNAEAVEEVVQAGAERAESIEAAAGACGVFMTMLPDGPQVKEVIGIAKPCLRRGAVVIDMSSIDPTVSRQVSASLAEIGVEMLDAPVSGGEPKAIDGTLAFMVGGSEEVFQQYSKLLSCMGSSVTLCGDIGSGNVVKLCNQVMVALNITALSEAMALGQLAGVAPEQMVSAVHGGLAGSAVLEAKAPMMLDQSFEPGFRVDLHMKDLKNALHLAQEVSAPLPLAGQAFEMMKMLHRDGFGGLDHSALIKYYEKCIGQQLHRRAPGNTGSIEEIRVCDR